MSPDIANALPALWQIGIWAVAVIGFIVFCRKVGTWSSDLERKRKGREKE